MKQPSYEELVRELRRQVTHEPDDGEATRLRVRESLRRRAQSKRKQRFLVPLAALLAASAAFAQYVRWSVAQEPRLATRALREAPGQSRESTDLERSLPRTSSDAARNLTDEPQAAVRTRELDHVPPRTASASRSDAGTSRREHSPRRGSARRAAEPHPSGSGVAVSPVSPSVSAREADALYGRAHRLHFRGDPSAALRAWDAYLAVADGGPRAIEARYNRAVVLIRLDRKREAVDALRPFAAGEHGAFRTAEANRLLRALEAGPR